MKKITNLLLGSMMAAFFCTAANAQIIYSNNFSGAGINISNTAPTYAATYAGGSASAVWLDVNGSATTHGLLLDNGINTSFQADYWALPFKAQSGHVYLLTVVLAFTNNPGIAAEFGYSVNTVLTNFTGDGRFNGSANGYDFLAPLFSGNPEFFAGNKAANAIAGTFTPGIGTNTFQTILDTRGLTGITNWVAAGCVNGIGLNGTFTYPTNLYANITNMTSLGISQNGTATLPTAMQYKSFVLETTLKPFIVGEPTASTIASGNGIYTNAVTVLADANGGSITYQWYANGAPLVNGVNGASGVDTRILTINPITSGNQFTNYYAIVNNNSGSATSSLASVIVLTNPVVTVPLLPTNSITLFGGSGGTFGSSPTFSVSASGAPSLDYRWYTNGVQIAGAGAINASSSTISFTNIQGAGPATFACVVSNAFGQVTNTWSATYVAAPTAGYPQAVLSALPLNFLRLNEPDNGLANGNKGVVSIDYGSGNNGIYTNINLGQSGYDSAEPSETSASFGTFSPTTSYDGRVRGPDFATPSGQNAEFTVEAWALTFADNTNSPVVTEGTLNVNDEFSLGESTNLPSTFFQFYVRAANGAVTRAVSTILANDFAWHHLVGVCDQANGIIILYVDGKVAATATIAPGAGIIEASAPLTIGAAIASGQTDYGSVSALQWVGNIADVATYKYALSAGQVVNQYSQVPGTFVAASFLTPKPLTNFAYQANQTLTIPIAVGGSATLSYFWTNVTIGGVIASGQTSVPGNLNATLTIPNASASLSGDLLELVASNPGSTTNLFVTLFNPPAPVTVDYTSSVLYSNLFLSSFGGGAWSIDHQHPTVANVLVGGTNSVWIDSLGTNDTGALQVNGTSTSPLQDSWTLPFVPQAGYIYTLSASNAFIGAPSSWVALGFCQNIVTNGAVGTTGKINGGGGSPNGIDWILWQQSGAPQYFATGTANLIGTATSTAGNVSHAVSVVLNTTGAAWTCFATIDGHTTSSGSFNPATNAINGIIIAQNGTGAANTNAIWNNVMLTQTAPGGVPPYLIPPAPSTNSIVLTNGTITIPATGFGSAAFGYSWLNNSTVLTSGVTNNMAPLPATLSIAGSSLSLGQLELIVTNAYGTNITIIPLISPFPTVGTNITVAVTNGTLFLSWPPSYLGAQLQAQTNPLSTGLGTNWVDYNPSTTTNMVAIPMNPTNGTVFFRFKH